jgi:hypothetical protein
MERVQGGVRQRAPNSSTDSWPCNTHHSVLCDIIKCIRYFLKCLTIRDVYCPWACFLFHWKLRAVYFTGFGAHVSWISIIFFHLSIYYSFSHPWWLLWNLLIVTRTLRELSPIWGSVKRVKSTEIVYIGRKHLSLVSIIELAVIIRYADRYDRSRNDTDR